MYYLRFTRYGKTEAYTLLTIIYIIDKSNEHYLKVESEDYNKEIVPFTYRITDATADTITPERLKQVAVLLMGKVFLLYNNKYFISLVIHSSCTAIIFNLYS